MKKRLLDYDRDARIATYHAYDHDTQVTYIETVQDVEPYLRANKAQMAHDTGGGGGLNDTSRRQIKESWWHVARIPVGVQYQWLRDYGVDVYNREHQERVLKLLDDPNWRYLRVNPGRVS